MAKIKAMPDVVKEESNPSVSFYDMKGKAPSLKVGDKVKAVIIGKVKEIGERESYDKKGEAMHHVCLERLDVKFAQVSEAEDMDMDEYVKWREGKSEKTKKS